jgi:hypothetical protein
MLSCPWIKDNSKHVTSFSAMFLQHMLVFSGKQKMTRMKVKIIQLRCFFSFSSSYFKAIVFQMTPIVCLIIKDYNWIQNDIEKQETKPVNTSNEENGAEKLATANYSEDSNDADYLKRMVNENPNNPLFLKKYAQFLFQVRLQTFFMFTDAYTSFRSIMLGLIQRPSKFQPFEHKMYRWY